MIPNKTRYSKRQRWTVILRTVQGLEVRDQSFTILGRDWYEAARQARSERLCRFDSVEIIGGSHQGPL